MSDGRVCCTLRYSAEGIHTTKISCVNGDSGVYPAQFHTHVNRTHIRPMHPASRDHTELLRLIHEHCGPEWGVCYSCTHRPCAMAPTKLAVRNIPDVARSWHVTPLQDGRCPEAAALAMPTVIDGYFS